VSTVRLTVALLLVAMTALVAGATREAATIPAAAAVEIPHALAGWNGVDLPLDAELQREIGADFVLNRAYQGPGIPELDLYVASYARQRPSTSIHSPLHCLPGTGWDILSNEIVNVNLQGEAVGPVRRLLAQKGQTRVLVLYWYSIHGRMVASEAMSRWWLLADRVRLGRNDAALVRLVVPVADSEAVSQEHGVRFIRTLVPYLQARQ